MEYTECINADKKASLYNKKPNYKDDDLEYASQKKVKNENEKEVSLIVKFSLSQRKNLI